MSRSERSSSKRFQESVIEYKNRKQNKVHQKSKPIGNICKGWTPSPEKQAFCISERE